MVTAPRESEHFVMVMAPLLVAQLYCACASAGGAGNTAADLVVAFTRSCAWSATVNASKSNSGSKLAANAVRKLVDK
jgi:hypothetical protein